jgi:hypothetical protein
MRTTLASSPDYQTIFVEWLSDGCQFTTAHRAKQNGGATTTCDASVKMVELRGIEPLTLRLPASIGKTSTEVQASPSLCCAVNE